MEKRTQGQINGDQYINFVDGDNYSGLTKREYFAGLAMQGIIVNYTSPFEYDMAKRAGIAVGLADALLEELSKPPQSKN